jgi:hypothetical protein
VHRPLTVVGTVRNAFATLVDCVVEGVVVVVVDEGEPVLKWQPRPGCANAASLTTGEGSGARLPDGCVVVDDAIDVVVVTPDVGTVVVVDFVFDVVDVVVAECDGGSYFS